MMTNVEAIVVFRDIIKAGDSEPPDGSSRNGNIPPNAPNL
jgi:hypothetical protein